MTSAAAGSDFTAATSGCPSVPIRPAMTSGIGGVVRSRDRGIIGEPAVDFIRQFKVDIALIGISGIEADGSLRDFDYREVKVAQTMIEHSREVWLAADASKFNRPAMVELATLSQIDRLFTDAPPPEPFPALLAEAGVRCDVAV